jgi:hypothetical protein
MVPVPLRLWQSVSPNTCGNCEQSSACAVSAWLANDEDFEAQVAQNPNPSEKYLYTPVLLMTEANSHRAFNGDSDSPSPEFEKFKVAKTNQIRLSGFCLPVFEYDGARLNLKLTRYMAFPF